jgi:hypothetical protein
MGKRLLRLRDVLGRKIHWKELRRRWAVGNASGELMRSLVSVLVGDADCMASRVLKPSENHAAKSGELVER